MFSKSKYQNLLQIGILLCSLLQGLMVRGQSTIFGQCHSFDSWSKSFILILGLFPWRRSGLCYFASLFLILVLWPHQLCCWCCFGAGARRRAGWLNRNLGHWSLSVREREMRRNKGLRRRHLDQWMTPVGWWQNTADRWNTHRSIGNKFTQKRLATTPQNLLGSCCLIKKDIWGRGDVPSYVNCCIISLHFWI